MTLMLLSICSSLQSPDVSVEGFWFLCPGPSILSLKDFPFSLTVLLSTLCGLGRMGKE